MGTLTHKAGVKFLKGFDHSMPARQSGMDRFAYNKLLEQFRAEYRVNGRVRTSRHRVNSWYTDLRNHSGPGWLRQSVSLMTRQTLYDLARHYDQYVEAEYLKACGAEPYSEWGEPRFRKHGDRISIPLHITHDNTVGDARFLNDRTIRISKMGDIRMSRPFPTTNYRPKTGRLFQTADGKWRITISCEVPDPEPYTGTPVVMGVDRNKENVATPDQLLVPPRRVIKRMQNAERTARRAQRMASRRQKPDGRNRKPGSRRWARAQKRAARNRRRAADIRHTMNHKKSRVIADSCTHPVFEKLSVKNMTKSAKGTEENPGTNVAQKAALNGTILNEAWGELKRMVAYKAAGALLLVAAAYTSQRCSVCGFTCAPNRDGREFLCLLCGHGAHADCNAGLNIENGGAMQLSGPVRRGRIKPRRDTVSDCPATTAGNAHVKGRLDAEGSSVGTPVKRQAWTGMRSPETIVLWDDV